MIHDVAPLAWVRLQAGHYRADAGRFGVFEVRRNPEYKSFPWALTPSGIGRECLPRLYGAKHKADYELVRRVWLAPVTLLERAILSLRGIDRLWLGARLINREHGRFQDAVSLHDPDGRHNLEVLSALDTLRLAQLQILPNTGGLQILIEDCLASPDLLGVLADAAQDAGVPALERATRFCMTFPSKEAP